MDLSTLAEQLNAIELEQFGLNRILLNLILQMFLKNNNGKLWGNSKSI